MDYERLLSLAERKSSGGRLESNKTRSVALSGVKKSKNGQKKPDPMAVASFLAAKKREEAMKAEEMRKKKEHLLYLRRQNTKANKAAKMMATRTKDNDFSKNMISEGETLEMDYEEPVDKINYREPQINPYDRTSRKQVMMGRKPAQEFIPGPLTKSPRKKVEEYSPTEPYINGKKKRISHLNQKEKIPAAKYKPTSQQTVKQPRRQVSPKPQPRRQVSPKPQPRRQVSPKPQPRRQVSPEQRPRRSIYPEYDPEKRLPIGATYKKNLRPDSPEYDRSPETSKRVPNSSLSRLAQKKLREEPLEYRNKVRRNDSYDELNRKSVQSVTQKPQPSVSKVSKMPVDKNKYSKESLNLYERNKKQQQMMSRQQRDEYSPPPVARSSMASKRSVEEYSPTEPYINGRKKLSHSKPSETIPSAKYTPTSRQQIVKQSRRQVSPEPEPRHSRDSMYSQYESQKKKLPIGATYKKDLRRSNSPVYQKQADITSRRVLNNPSFDRVMQTKKKVEPPEHRRRMCRMDAPDDLIKKNVQKVMQKPRTKLPPIGLNYRRGMYGASNDIEYDESVEDEEEDDEMRDFIDDGDYADVVDDDYSKYIREIFGYDKRKYIDDDDDEVMEATFDQQEREELRSAKIGILEDLHDMKMEAEEKRRKALLRKRRQIIDDDEDEDDDDD